VRYNKNYGRQGKIGEAQTHPRLNISKTRYTHHITIKSAKISGFRLRPLA
jgi:hypothetical protein